MKIILWHLGRKGAGPKYNLEMALALKKKAMTYMLVFPSRRKMQMIIRNITLITYRLIHIRGFRINQFSAITLVD